MENFKNILIILGIIIAQAALLAWFIQSSISRYKKYWKNGSNSRKWLLIFADSLLLMIIIAGVRGWLS